MPILASLGAGAIGAYRQFRSGAAPIPNYIEEVFSTYLYTGTGSSQTITNGIDLSTKGGLVWTKVRNTTFRHGLQDTARGVGKLLSSNNTLSEQSDSTSITSFNTDGFSLGADSLYASCNYSGSPYTSWTFRKQAKFFDVVTYTGNNAGQTLNHNLGSTPGFIYIKCRSAAGEIGAVYHRSLGTSNYLIMEQTVAAQSSTGFWATPTSTTFFVPSSMSANGVTYVAYLFAHDAGGFGLSGSDNVISCGSYVGNGSGTGPTVELGYEPQWILIKGTGPTTTASNWLLFDVLRGISTSYADNYLLVNTAGAENETTNWLDLSSTGFQIRVNNTNINTSGDTYVYIAIRRGPMKTPTSGTNVYNGILQVGTSTFGTIESAGFPVDAVFTKVTDSSTGGSGTVVATRITSSGSTYGNFLRANSIAAEASSSDLYGTMPFASMTGLLLGSGGANSRETNHSQNSYIHWNFRRAPGFFDVVTYTGTGSARTVGHNLGVVPEMMIVKMRSGTAAWAVFHSSTGSGKYLFLNTTGAADTGSGSTYWNSTLPTSSVFSVGTNADTNNNGSTYIAYLFASCTGVSKVGSYTGTGTTKQIDCGFAAGARFVMIKRTDANGDWYVWDTARGIVAGNDPYLILNSVAAEVTSTDYVDTYSAGFEISSTAPADINANGGTYIFLAIA